MDVIATDVLVTAHAVVGEGGPLPKQAEGMCVSTFVTDVEKHAEVNMFVAQLNSYAT